MQSAREEREPTDYLSHIDDLRKQRKENFPMIQVVFVPPEGKPYPSQIFPTKDELTKQLGGLIEIIELSPIHQDAVIAVRVDSRWTKGVMNPIGTVLVERGLYDSIHGTIIVLGMNPEEELISIPHELKIRLLSIYAD